MPISRRAMEPLMAANARDAKLRNPNSAAALRRAEEDGAVLLATDRKTAINHDTGMGPAFEAHRDDGLATLRTLSDVVMNHRV
ncbi:hypothetical protein DFK10_04355 [Salibaculum griseiflavum]|uniref:Uncharacterized protein n=1 Tax=Salibaculum griseiflavum TaxID=1914409 RepID=A0A2V1P643_9RHOB|nr:hypothetical protein DFK10_04355 [Salibaculum griseiflavum]